VAENASHELDAPPWLRVESTLMATARAIRTAYDRRFAGLGLNLSQASLLAFVADFGPETQTRLARRLGLGRAATGTLIDALERRSLVERRPDPDDRRVWLVAITEEGERTVDEITDIDRTLRNELRRGISKAERQQLAHTLLGIQANLARALEDIPDPSAI
jgi:DNA-binding MarR family transcriptional regulator